MDNNAGLAFLFFVFIIIIIWFFSMSGSVRERKFMFREGLDNKSNKPFWKTSNQSWIKCLRDNNCTQKELIDQLNYYNTGKYSNSDCYGWMATPQTKKWCKKYKKSLNNMVCPTKKNKECIIFNEITAPGKFGNKKNCSGGPAFYNSQANKFMNNFKITKNDFNFKNECQEEEEE